jgi:hypothetical protein
MTYVCLDAPEYILSRFPFVILVRESVAAGDQLSRIVEDEQEGGVSGEFVEKMLRARHADESKHVTRLLRAARPQHCHENDGLSEIAPVRKQGSQVWAPCPLSPRTDLDLGSTGASGPRLPDFLRLFRHGAYTADSFRRRTHREHRSSGLRRRFKSPRRFPRASPRGLLGTLRQFLRTSPRGLLSALRQLLCTAPRQLLGTPPLVFRLRTRLFIRG